MFNHFGAHILNVIIPAWAAETAEHVSCGQFIASKFRLNMFGMVVACWLPSQACQAIITKNLSSWFFSHSGTSHVDGHVTAPLRQSPDYPSYVSLHCCLVLATSHEDGWRKSLE
jgi:hypothetical protein